MWPFLRETASVLPKCISFRPHESKLPPNSSCVVGGTYHGEDSDTSECVTKQDAQRSGLSECSANTQEQTSTDRAAESDELDVTRFQPFDEISETSAQDERAPRNIPARDVSIIFSSLDVAIHVRCFSHPHAFVLDDPRGIVI